MAPPLSAELLAALVGAAFLDCRGSLAPRLFTSLFGAAPASPPLSRSLTPEPSIVADLVSPAAAALMVEEAEAEEEEEEEGAAGSDGGMADGGLGCSPAAWADGPDYSMDEDGDVASNGNGSNE